MSTPALFGSIGHWEILIVAFVILVVFGTQVPRVARALGKSLSQFKRGLHDVDDEPDEKEKKEPDPPADGS